MTLFVRTHSDGCLFPKQHVLSAHQTRQDSILGGSLVRMKLNCLLRFFCDVTLQSALPCHIQNYYLSN